MAVGLPERPQLAPVAGIRLGTARAGIRQLDRADLLVIEAVSGSRAAAVFTRNRFCAAPVIIARRHLAQSSPLYCLINSGNANAGTGEAGMQAALASCQTLADLANCARESVLPFSTGVIGEPLPLERIQAALPAVLEILKTDAWLDAARAIMTTDTLPKGLSVHFDIAGKPAVLTGIVKGAGMIRPDMATMLAFLATDAAVEQPILQRSLKQAAGRSFNRITIDGDTSTNDACVLLATGSGEAEVADPAAEAEFQTALNKLCAFLAQAVIRDGEGVTRFVTVTVAVGSSEAECLKIAYAISESPLVKTALFAADPNWGRILAAVGRSGPQDLDISRVAIYIDDCCIVREGGRASDYREADAQAIMSGTEYTLRVELGRGAEQATVWTCDLSHDYVRINAEYRT